VPNVIDLVRPGFEQASGIGGTAVSEEIRATSNVKTKVVAPGKRYSAHNPASPYSALKRKHAADGAGGTGERTRARPTKLKRPSASSEVASSTDPEWAAYVAQVLEKECPKCGFINGADDVRCGNCGYALEVICPNCGATTPTYGDYGEVCLACDEPLYEQADEEDEQAHNPEAQEAGELRIPEEDAIDTRRGFDGVDAFLFVGFAAPLHHIWDIQTRGS
jgi:hypothetical protein